MKIPVLWLRYRRIFFVLMFLVALLGIVQWADLRQDFSLAYLRQALSANRWTGLAAFVLLFTLGNLVQVPGWLFLASAVLVLGKLGGGLATYVAACISCAITFLAVRWVGGDAVQRMDSPLASKWLAQLHLHPIRNVLLLRTVFQTLAALNYALAMSGIGFRKYMVATLLGLPLPIAIYCLLFDYIAKIANLG
ncbi:VTT domain-containing protein [Rhodoferax sp. UBA5149]|uniref:VTT domain-containing protein n=1 Tax=Rhodoferax sp. UBA5149 TaxID=1947379 RepID=UPI0025D400FD|nr:VTT domain-containing protein [Rhodoferax sp. UBA5149]